MEDALLSVVVPVYNMEKYVSTCIDALLNQTYRSFQIILVDDCSEDASLSILREYKKNNSDKILLIESETNIGLGGARNLGIRSSKSEYIGFVDPDDLIYPTMYEELMSLAVKERLDIVFCGYETVHESATLKEVASRKKKYSENLEVQYWNTIPDDIRMSIMSSSKYGTVWSGVYKRELIESNNLFFPENLIYEDCFWSYAIILEARSIGIVKEPLYFYRQRNESLSNKRNTRQHYDRIEIGKKLYGYVKDKGYLSRYHLIVEFLFITVFTLNTYLIVLGLMDKPDVDKLNQIRLFLKNNFPKWKRNSLFHAKRSIIQRVIMTIIMIFPAEVHLRFMLIWKIAHRVASPCYQTILFRNHRL